MNWTTPFKDLVDGYTAITTTHGRSNASKYSHIPVGIWLLILYYDDVIWVQHQQSPVVMWHIVCVVHYLSLITT